MGHLLDKLKEVKRNADEYLGMTRVAPLENPIAPGHHAGDQIDMNFPERFDDVDAELGWTFEPNDLPV
ncbi:MAG: hypothetical protein Q9168_003258 [Polycauliona sp. 1 TL-2023]